MIRLVFLSFVFFAVQHGFFLCDSSLAFFREELGKGGRYDQNESHHITCDIIYHIEKWRVGYKNMYTNTYMYLPSKLSFWRILGVLGN